MKFVIQRVIKSCVTVDGNVIGSINRGLLVLVGFTKGDNKSDINFAANKLLNIRLWSDSNDKTWSTSVKDNGFEILLVSQFTLYSFFKGNKPDFHLALNPVEAEPLYDYFVETLKTIYNKDKISTGKFGHMMEVSLVNDGPVTMNWEYPTSENSDQDKLNKDTSKINSNISQKNQNKGKNNTKSKHTSDLSEKDYFSDNKQEININKQMNNNEIDIDIDKDLEINSKKLKEEKEKGEFS